MKISKEIAKLCLENNLTIGCAESCTGGRIAHDITKIPGSSAYFKGSIVSYQEIIKVNVLNVPQELIDKHTAESADVVTKMAENVKQLLDVDYAVATSGHIGPKKYKRRIDGKICNYVYVCVTGPNCSFTTLFELGINRNRKQHIKSAADFAMRTLCNLIYDDLKK